MKKILISIFLFALPSFLFSQTVVIENKTNMELKDVQVGLFRDSVIFLADQTKNIKASHKFTFNISKVFDDYNKKYHFNEYSYFVQFTYFEKKYSFVFGYGAGKEGVRLCIGRGNVLSERDSGYESYGKSDLVFIINY